ncbi:2-oxoglutarate dehydrogenase E1 component [bacterium]|nr:2-oxoglutarate dehydrogenase E1 component [bacterium]
MSSFSYLNNANPAFIDDLFQQYSENPETVDAQWRDFFKGYEFSEEGSSKNGTPLTDKEVSVMKLIHAYRTRGHLISDTNPIRQRRKHKADLSLSYFNLSEDDFETEFACAVEIKLEKTTLANILAHLKKTYCRSIGTEFMYCSNEKLRQWLYNKMESCANQPKVEQTETLSILNKLGQAVNFENFLQTKYVGKKRFSLEGLEVLIPALYQAIHTGAKEGVQECVLGMAHRGRLNVLVNIFQKSYEDVFSEFEENITFDFLHTGGDVKYHLGKSADIITEEGHKVHLNLVPNPSHLEAVSPVLQGIVYGKKQKRYNHDDSKILPIVIHGDAAISGQGVNYEVANFSKIEGYDNGGTIHIVTNNQVGFTANYKESRSSIYCTDLAKVTDSPVFHVNADDPEAVSHAIKMAVNIRQQFHCDVYVDILGYRKYGHNEGDEPRFTQPIMYKSLSKRKNVYQMFLDKLVNSGAITTEDAKSVMTDFKSDLQTQLEHAKDNPIEKKPDMFKSSWQGFRLATQDDFETSIQTGVKKTVLDNIVTALTTAPESFNVFSKMNKIIDNRKTAYKKDKQVDWALAEQLAFGTLLEEGHDIRLSGQDSQRGTFSHRHAVIKDEKTETNFVPLNHISKTQGTFEVYNSLLSEYGVMGFEFGFSLSRPNSLAIWEAQFGDFANGSQIVMDQFISCSEAKWQRMSGLVLLLPHGYEGQGPEHSSARLERYLQACAENNMYVCNITSPANFFHVLRRQLHNEFRKPLIIMSPKSLLRHPEVVSPVAELTKGRFQEILDDETVKSAAVKRVLCCTGKIYYDLNDARNKAKKNDVAIVRFEQLYPISESQINALKKKYSKATFTWVQEEPENMGAWAFILQHYRNWNFDVISRPAGASPATGSSKIHAAMQTELVERAINQKGGK